MEQVTFCNSCKSDNFQSYQVAVDVIRIDSLCADNFAVTDKDYGKCLDMILCSSCGLIQPAYILDSSYIVKLYSSMTDKEYLKEAEMRGESNYTQVIKLIKKYNSDAQSLLEIGAGNGYMLKLLSNDGFEVKGLEPNTSFCVNAKKKYGIEMENCGYESFKTDKQYDIIIGLDIIEHVVDVSDFMQKVEELLAPGGIVILCTPNKNSFAARFFGKKWWHIRPPHLYYFTPESFSMLAGQHNLKILNRKYFYWTFPLYYLCDALQELLFKHVIIALPFLSFKIRLNTLDSHIYLLCRN